MLARHLDTSDSPWLGQFRSSQKSPSNCVTGRNSTAEKLSSCWPIWDLRHFHIFQEEKGKTIEEPRPWDAVQVVGQCPGSFGHREPSFPSAPSEFKGQKRQQLGARCAMQMLVHETRTNLWSSNQQMIYQEKPLSNQQASNNLSH